MGYHGIDMGTLDEAKALAVRSGKARLVWYGRKGATLSGPATESNGFKAEASVHEHGAPFFLLINPDGTAERASIV